MMTYNVLKAPLSAVVLLWCCASQVFSQEPDNEKVDPVLTALQENLEHVLAGLKPSPKFDIPAGYAGKSLNVRFQTRKYMVYPSDKTGRLGKELVEQKGPDDGGFILEVQVQTKGKVNQAVVPQTIQAPYWITRLNVYPVADSEKQLYLALSYRGRTNNELIEKILATAKQVCAN